MFIVELNKVISRHGEDGWLYEAHFSDNPDLKQSVLSISGSVWQLAVRQLDQLN